MDERKSAPDLPAMQDAQHSASQAELHEERQDTPCQADGHKASSGHVAVSYIQAKTVEYIFKFSIKALAKVL